MASITASLPTGRRGQYLAAALPLDAAFTVYAFRVGTGKEDTQ